MAAHHHSLGLQSALNQAASGPLMVFRSRFRSLNRHALFVGGAEADRKQIACRSCYNPPINFAVLGAVSPKQG